MSDLNTTNLGTMQFRMIAANFFLVQMKETVGLHVQPSIALILYITPLGL